MDPAGFDQISRTLASTPTRRSALASIAGALTALVARLAPANAPDAAAKPKVCRPLGKPCFPDRGLDCCRSATCQNGRCRCPKRSRRCGNRCLTKGKCCRHKDCPGNQRCATGRCQCPAELKRCQGDCIARDACCRDDECAPHEACRQGSCGCARGTKQCGEACIPDGACCQDGDCEIIQACQDHICVNKPCGAGGPCRVFVTSADSNGSLGGVAGADATCQAAANSSTLTQGGTYKAWLSGSTGVNSPSQRFTNLDKTGPYVLVDAAGTVIADNWADLTTSTSGTYLKAPITVAEDGESSLFAYAWTNTEPDGTPTSTDESLSCNDWTNTVNVEAGYGYEEATDAGWTALGLNRPCRENHFQLYCFEQG